MRLAELCQVSGAGPGSDPALPSHPSGDTGYTLYLALGDTDTVYTDTPCTQLMISTLLDQVQEAAIAAAPAA